MTSRQSDKTWLGGNPQGKWADYYELLGLPFGFSDAVVIARVADQLMKRIRVAAKQDADADRLRGIAKSVLEAKSCLTDPERKARYDEKLKSQNDSQAVVIETASGRSPGNTLANEDIPQAIPVAIPISNTAASETESLPFTASDQEAISHRLRRRSSLWFMFGTAIVSGGLFTALALLSKHFLLDNVPPIVKRTPSVNGTSAGSPIDPNPTGPAHGDPLETVESTDAIDGSNATRSDNSPAHEKNSMTGRNAELAPPAKAIVSPLTREEAKKLSSALKAAKRSLLLRDFTAATKSLARAHEIARHPKHKELVERLEDLTHYAQEYWAAIDDAWKDLSAGLELRVGNTIVNVVEVDFEKIIVRDAGRNKTVHRDELPIDLQTSIFESWLDPSAASSDVIRGAFYATQNPPDEQAARDHWKSARRRGADIKNLTAVLIDSYAVDDLLNVPNKLSD